MATVAQSMPPQVIDEVLQEVAPDDLQNEELIQFKVYLQKLDAKQLKSLINLLLLQDFTTSVHETYWTQML